MPSGEHAPGRVLVVGGLVLARGRVLLGYRHPTRRYYPACWDVPGGHVQAGESSQAAVRRELGEELGVDVDLPERPADFRLVGDNYDLQLWVVPTWRGQLINRAPHEHAELYWFAVDELGSLPLADARYVEVLSAAISANGANPGLTVRRARFTGVPTISP